MQDTDIEYLLQKWTDNTLNAAERSQLEQLLEDPGQKDMVINIMQRQMLALDTAPAFDDVRFMPLFRQLLSADTGAPPVRRMWGKWAAAAAVLVLVLTTAVLMIARRQGSAVQGTAEHKNPITDAAPGSDKAILTLANGTKIILDSAQNGRVAIQGGTNVVKTDDGRVRYDAGSHAEATQNLLVTPRGGKYQVTLPDGTQVWLNAASSMRYPTAFTGNERTVTITGEAYFEVAKDPGKPFVVKVNGLSMEVLGTHFNINAYSDETVLRATLVEGSIRVKDASMHMAILKPGQEAQVAGDQPSIKVVSGIDTAQVMAWKNGLFQFRNTDLASVMRQLARWYDLDIVYEGRIPTDRFDGKIPRDATAAQVLAVLQKNQVHFKIEGKKLIVLP